MNTSPAMQETPKDDEEADVLRLLRGTALLWKRTREALQRKDDGVETPDDFEEELGYGPPPWNPDGEDGPHGQT